MSNAIILITIGGLLLAALILDQIGKYTKLPRVTLLVLLGVAAGPSGLAILPAETTNGWYPLVTVVALVMVAFLLGGNLTRHVLVENGKNIMGVSVSVVLGTVLIVALGLWLLGINPILALVFAGVSAATDPAATQDVVRETHSDGPFTRTLLGTVAIDDAWGLIVFSLLLAFGHALLGEGAIAGESPLEIATVEIGGALLIGTGVGIPAAWLSSRLQPGEPSQFEALGIVFFAGGLALWVGASYLLTAMIAGLIVANRAKEPKRAFREVEHFERPFMILFFVLAGASLEVEALPAIGLIGLAFMVLRVLGRLAGGWVGAKLSGMSAVQQIWVGPALLPQAGVAMGMALVAAETFPDLATEIMAIAVGTTIIFELVGPLVTKIALVKTGEVHAGE